MQKKMMLAIVPKTEAEYVLNALVDAGFTATFTETEGGVLHQQQLTLFIIVNENEVERVLALIAENCRMEMAITQKEDATVAVKSNTSPTISDTGGAIVFIWSVDRIETF